MEPVTLGLIISAAFSAYGGYVQYETAQTQAKQAEVNAKAQQEQAVADAEQERLNRAANERNERKSSDRRRALMRAQIAQSGVMLSGTPSLVLAEQAAEDEQDILNRNRASIAKRAGIIHAGKNAVLQGGMTASAYRAQGTAGLISTAGSIAGYGIQYGKHREQRKRNALLYPETKPAPATESAFAWEID